VGGEKQLEAEVGTLDDRWLMMRIQPYRTIENRIDGVVVTLADATELKRAEEALAIELNAMGRLQQLSTRVAESAELEPALMLVLDTTMELLAADLGYIQLYDSDSGELRSGVVGDGRLRRDRTREARRPAAQEGDRIPRYRPPRGAERATGSRLPRRSQSTHSSVEAGWEC
jgi:hypothetical protein